MYLRYLEYSLCICDLDDMVDFIDIADTVEVWINY